MFSSNEDSLFTDPTSLVQFKLFPSNPSSSQLSDKMYFTTVLSILAVAASVLAAPAEKITKRYVTAILQFEIDPDTFTSDTEVSVPGTVTVNEEMIQATIAEVDGSNDPDSVFCQAYNAYGNKIGDTFTLLNTTVFDNGNLVEISTVTCQD